MQAARIFEAESLSAVCGFAKLPSLFVEEVIDGEVVGGRERSRKNLMGLVRDFFDNPAATLALLDDD